MKGRYELDKKFSSAEIGILFISEITLAELKFGVAKSAHVTKNQQTLDDFLQGVQIIPIITCLDIYAFEKARLQKKGLAQSEFDILIGATAVANNLRLVTNNVRHFENIEGIMLENWIQ